MSTFIEDNKNQNPNQKQKPVEFTDVIKPDDVDTSKAAATSPSNPDINLPPESQGAASVAASLSDSKEWKPFMSQLNDAQIRDVKRYAPQEQFEIEVNGQLKTYTRRKIKTKDYTELEQLRARFALATGIERTMLQIEIFKKAALYYFGMSEEEFEDADYETVKKICDANNIRTLYGVPNSR